MNSLLEFINTLHPYDPVYGQIIGHMIEDGINYPEKALKHLQEEVTDRLSQF